MGDIPSVLTTLIMGLHLITEHLIKQLQQLSDKNKESRWVIDNHGLSAGCESTTT